MRIRDASRTDVPAITAIYNEVIAHTTAVYTEQPMSEANRLQWFEARQRLGYPVLVCEDDGVVVGLASFGEFRTWPDGYLYSVEHSVHVDARCRGRGIGRALVVALIDRARALGKHVLVGAIDSENEASLRLHASLGFERVAHFKQVGVKFGRWLDAVFVQKMLDDAPAPPAGGASS